MQITLGSHTGFIVLCLFVGLIYAGVLYYRNNKFPPALSFLLATFRFVVVSVICFLLLSPASTFWDEDLEKPVILWLQDNSSSVVSQKDTLEVKSRTLKNINELKSSIGQSEVEVLLFDEDLKSSDSIDFSGVGTNLSTVLNNVDQLYKHKNVAAIVLSTDGIYNQGYDPRYVLDDFTIPIYSLVLGDTVTNLDSRLEHVQHNKIAYKNNLFPIEVETFIEGANSGNLELSVWNKNKKIASQEIKVKSNPFSKSHTFYIKAKEAGLAEFTIKLSPYKEERYTKNNEQSIYVDIVESKKKIMIVSELASPDIRAVLAALEPIEEYEVELKKPSEIVSSLQDYSLVILYQFPNSQTQGISNYLSSYKGNLLFVLGRKSNIKALNKYQDFFEYRTNKEIEDVNVYNHSNFGLFSAEQEGLEFFQSTPPVSAIISPVQYNVPFEHLYFAKVMGVETEQAVVSFAKTENRNVGIINAEGFWRWRIYDYKDNSSFNYFDELIRKSVRFTSTSEKLDRFKIDVPSKVTEHRSISINAELYNPSYELTNRGEVSLKVTKSESGNTVDYALIPGINNYSIKLNGLESGWYNYKSEAILDQDLFKKSGRFFVEPTFVENANLKANYQLLSNLSAETNANVYLEDQFPELVKDLGNLPLKSRLHSTLKSKEWIHFKWLFGLIILLLSMEWFLRKRNGAY